MATYLPGVQTLVPQTQVFTPDYKFLQDVLSVRQDRYDTNFKEIKDKSATAKVGHGSSSP